MELWAGAVGISCPQGLYNLQDIVFLFLQNQRFSVNYCKDRTVFYMFMKDNVCNLKEKKHLKFSHFPHNESCIQE